MMYLKPLSVPVTDTGTYDRAGLWMNMDDAGFKIVDVTKGGPAEAAGLKVGDIITKIDGSPAVNTHLYDLRQRLRNDAPGTVVEFAVKRGDKTETCKVTLRDLI